MATQRGWTDNGDAHRATAPSSAITIAGLPITLPTQDAFFDAVVAASREGRRVTIYNINARMMHLAHRAEPWLMRAVREPGAEVICDSSLPQLIARLTGQAVPERLAFNRWMDDFLATAAERGLSIYFLGSTPENLARLRTEIAARFPTLRVAGMMDGYRPLFEPGGADAAIHAINESRADVLFVALGMPLQERWITTYRPRLDAAAVLPCGGALDFLSGRNRTAPALVSQFGLEWIFRAALEPRRLLKRNLTDVSHAVWYAARAHLRRRVTARAVPKGGV